MATRTLLDPDDADLLHRWQRMQMIVRCGLSSVPADYVRLYLLIGRKIARRGIRPPDGAQRQMLRTLLQTAQDEALPWSCRTACLEHTALLLAHLRALIGWRDPIAMRGIEAAVEETWDRLLLAPGSNA